MTNCRWVMIVVLAGSLGLFNAQTLKAQDAEERLATMKTRVEQVKAFANRLPQHARRHLSSGALNLIHLSEQWDLIGPGLSQVPPRLQEAPTQHRVRGMKRVSDPNLDGLSALYGFTQSETSTAWCGNTVVVGFNDTGSFFESLSQSNSGIGGLSTVGVARSTNRGSSFTDLGFLNPGPGVADLLFSDPVVACADQNTFYYASMFLREVTIATPLDSSTAIASDVSVSKSTDRGATWDNPVSVVSKGFSSHLLDKPWMAVDPTDTNRLYLTYTAFDTSGVVCGVDQDGLPILRIAIELVRSGDGGATWDAFPAVIAEGCGFDVVQGSQVAVGPDGEVYVAWLFPGLFSQIVIRKSTDKGESFGPEVIVGFPTCTGDCELLKGRFRNQPFPSLAVDRSGRATRGFVYIAWNDAGDVVQDPFFGTYFPSEVFVSRSTDRGSTWSDPIRVNNNPDPSAPGFHTDQYNPGIAVDKRGNVGVCFYDRRNDPNNLLIDRFCAKSTNAGDTWKNKQITREPFAPVPCQDQLVSCSYMGDYDTLASDFIQINGGFIGAWGDNSLGNPDVVAGKF